MSESARLTTMTPMMTPTVIRWAFLFPMSMAPFCGMPVGARPRVRSRRTSGGGATGSPLAQRPEGTALEEGAAAHRDLREERLEHDRRVGVEQS